MHVNVSGLLTVNITRAPPSQIRRDWLARRVPEVLPAVPYCDVAYDLMVVLNVTVVATIIFSNNY